MEKNPRLFNQTTTKHKNYIYLSYTTNPQTKPMGLVLWLSKPQRRFIYKLNNTFFTKTTTIPPTY